MIRVIIASPYAGDVERNVAYAERCLRESLARGEAPFASHLLYTRVLDDTDPIEREQGLMAEEAWLAHAEAVALYVDLGRSPGMERIRRAAVERHIAVVERYIGESDAAGFYAQENRR